MHSTDRRLFFASLSYYMLGLIIDVHKQLLAAGIDPLGPFRTFDP